jgi:RNA recognition motif-containing protein
LQAPLPYAFNYHHDNGVFRGLAFANFRHPHEADAVVVALNGYDISGRKLRVEYKKVLQAGEKERIEREKAIKRMRSMQFDRGQLSGGGVNGTSSGTTGRSVSGAFNGQGQNRQGSWSQPNNSNNNQGGNSNANSQGNHGNNQQNALSGIPASLLASMTPQQLQSLAASLPGSVQNLSFGQQGQALTPPLTTQSQSSGSGGMVSHLSHVYVPQHVNGALIRERTESTNTTGSQNVQRDGKNGPESAFGAGSMQAMQQQHLQQLQNPDRLPSPALSLGGASHHGSSNGGHGPLSPSLGPNAFAQSQPMQATASNPGSQTGYNDVDFNDPVVLDIFSRALMFKEDRMRDEFSFSRNLSVKDRRAVHAVGEKLGLHHYSTGEGSDRYVVLSKVDPSRNNPSRVSPCELLPRCLAGKSS